MAHSSSIFSRVPIEVPNRSGFDMSHENLGTATCGTLIPVLVDEILPNDTISLGSSFQVQLPPMATDFYGRVDFVLEAFFVPNRLLWGGWKDFMTHPTANPVYPEGTPVAGKPIYQPLLNFSSGTYLGQGTLADYLGYKAGANSAVVDGLKLNALPFLAYHRIWDDWYRDSRIQAPLFYAPNATMATSGSFPMFVPYSNFSGVTAPLVMNPEAVSGSFTGSISTDNNICSLRQRNWAKDYYTTASPLPQAGNASTLTFSVSVDTGTTEEGIASGDGHFSISALRAANSMQKWMERNNIAGYRYSDQIYAQYGIYPSDAIMDKCIYLGRKTQNVYTRSVFQTAPSSSESGQLFNSVGAKAGSSQAIGEGSLVDNFRATEHGFLFVLASLVPHAYYSTGIRRYLFNRKEVSDYAFPLLSGMGDQSISPLELSSFSTGTDESVFGYTDLYAEYKYHDDEVHGLLVDGNSLSAFALQRTFNDVPELGSDFLQIPKTFLDQVFSASVAVSGFSCWYDIYFPYKKISTLPEYSLPTLADLKHTHTVHMSRGGKRL